MSSNSPVNDPYEVVPEGSGELIEFYSYRNPLSRSQVIQVLNDATFSALEHESESLMGRNPIQTWGDDVVLTFIPDADLTWFMWTRALRGMRSAVTERRLYFEWSFVVASSTPGHQVRLGFGMLEGFHKQTLANNKM